MGLRSRSPPRNRITTVTYNIAATNSTLTHTHAYPNSRCTNNNISASHSNN